MRRWVLRVRRSRRAAAVAGAASGPCRLGKRLSAYRQSAQGSAGNAGLSPMGWPHSKVVARRVLCVEHLPALAPAVTEGPEPMKQRCSQQPRHLGNPPAAVSTPSHVGADSMRGTRWAVGLACSCLLRAACQRRAGGRAVAQVCAAGARTAVAAGVMQDCMAALRTSLAPTLQGRQHRMPSEGHVGAVSQPSRGGRRRGRAARQRAPLVSGHRAPPAPPCFEPQLTCVRPAITRSP